MSSIQISIADPCHENWNAMLPEEKGRFCLSCQKTVVDFTSMADGQVFDYFKNYKGSTCGQFSKEQLNRDIAKPATHSIGRWKYFWQILLPAVFAFHKGEAQTLKGKVAPKTMCKADTVKPARIMMGMVALPLHTEAPIYKLRGTILDEKQQPVPYATVVSDVGKQVMADSTGHFTIEIAPGQNLTISYVGYETKIISYDSLIAGGAKNIEVDKKSNEVTITADVQLYITTTVLGEVVAVGYNNNSLIGKTGGISIRSKRFPFSRLKDVKFANDSSTLKIFPNLVQPGQSFQISLQLKKTGSYLLRITDAEGKMMLEEKLNITSSSQIEKIGGNVLRQAGMYFINVKNPADRKEKDLTGRIVVQ